MTCAHIKHLPLIIYSGCNFNYNILFPGNEGDYESEMVQLESYLNAIEEESSPEETVNDQQNREAGIEYQDLLYLYGEFLQSRFRCYNMIYIMAFTSGSAHAESKDRPYLSLTLRSRQSGSIHLPDNPGNDQMKNKGDLWKLSISSIFKGRRSCVRKGDIDKVVLRNGGNDGWKIESLVTVLGYRGYYTVLTADIGFNKAIDGNLDLKPSTHEITLTNVYP